MAFRGPCQPQPFCDPMNRERIYLLIRVVLEVLCTKFVMHEKAGFVSETLLSEEKPKDAKYIPYSLLINKISLM